MTFRCIKEHQFLIIMNIENFVECQKFSGKCATASRTFASPVEECNLVLKKNCLNEKDLNASKIREISTAITKLCEYKMLNLVDETEIINFLQLQNNILVNSESFPFDLVEIALKILGSPEMPLKIYSDEWIKEIIDRLHKLCVEKLFVHSDEPSQLHKLFPLVLQLSKLVQQIALTDSIIIELISIGIPSYLYPESSPSLQTAACSLLTAIFRRYSQFQTYLIDEIFSEIKANRGSPKILMFSNSVRKQIQAISRLFLEFVQSISSFPCDTDGIVKGLINDILKTFFNRSIENTSLLHLFEQFIEDLGICLTHPFYPAAEPFLKVALEFFFQRMKQKSKISRIAIKLASNSLNVINMCVHKNKEILKVELPLSVFQSITEFPQDKFNEIINSENSHILSEEGKMFLIIDSTFPSNNYELILSRFIIYLFLKQSYKLSDVLNTALHFHISQWSIGDITNEESSNYLLWWREIINDTISFEWTIDIAEKIYINQITKHPMFESVHLLIQHLLRGLENKNSAIRSQLLKGFSSIIEVEPNLLYHPLLVEQIKNAFNDPCASIRDAVLEIITNYIKQNDQIESPYFNVVINCLADSSSMVVRRALTTVSKFAGAANDESLSSLCYLLSLKLQDPVPQVSKLAHSSFVQALFEYAKDKGKVIIQVISRTNNRPKWFSHFFKSIYSKYNQEIKAIIQEITEMLYNEPSYQCTFVLREFCESFPKLFVAYHDKLISFFNSCQDDQILSILPDALSSIIPNISSPNLTMFKLMMKPIEQIICSKPSNIVRPVIELCSKIITYIFPESGLLTNIQQQFCMFLRSNIKEINNLDESIPEKKILVNQIIRALFVTGCIYRYYISKHQKKSGNSLWGPVGAFFKSKIPRIRTMVLQCACDICVGNCDFIEKAKGLVNASFELGPPESISAVVFLKNLLIQESLTEDTTAIDEIRPCYSSNLLQNFLPKIKESFLEQNSEIRTATLELIRVALLHGMTNPHEVIPYVIALLCSIDQRNLAKEVIKEIVYSFPDALTNRFSDGLKKGFEYAKMVTNGDLSNYCYNDNIYLIGEIFSFLNASMKKAFLDTIVHLCKEALDSNKNNDWIKWLMYTIMNITFSLSNEPGYLIKKLNNETSTLIHSIFSDARNIVCSLGKSENIVYMNSGPQTWFSSILILKLKHWVIKKYQIKIKNIDKILKEEKPVKVSKIDGLCFSDIPEPTKLLLNDSILDLFAIFQSTIRMERSIIQEPNN